jgi:hypothetical protein
MSDKIQNSAVADPQWQGDSFKTQRLTGDSLQLFETKQLHALNIIDG